jgi:solute carrier family 20 (sodium-dependent phosphate transporter)
MYLWIVIAGGVSAFVAAMGIGANDAANAFATSVGSGALTLRQAAALAVVFETGGAILMGSHVTDTIRNSIADYQCFEDNPDIFMYGCLWVIIAVGSWLFIASYFEMPVSTTHSCIGGMVGMTVVLAGPNCVIWYKPLETFPYVGGVSGIIMSWFISPVFSGLLASFIYGCTRCIILRKPYTTRRLLIIYPVLVGTTLLINSFFIIYKGAKGLGLDNIEAVEAIGYSLAIAGGGAFLTIPLIPKIKRKVDKKFDRVDIAGIAMQNLDNIRTSRTELNINTERQLQTVISIHQNAEQFNPKIEETFKYLQVFSAVCDSFSHGANDVANAIGPFAAIYTIYKSDGDLSKNISMEDDAYLILGLGGVGIGLGLVVYGKKIIHAIGNKLCKITPSRGTCIELSSALIIITGSRLKIPLSTTHCQVGATVGVGLLENKSCRHLRTTGIMGVNGYILAKTAFGWIITCAVVGATTALMVAQGVYSPTIGENINNLTNCSPIL